MAVLFFDSSGLVKRYITETGSVWVKSLTQAGAGHAIWVAGITGPEMVSAVTRRRNRGETTPADAAAAIIALRADLLHAYYTVDITLARLTAAMDLAELHGLRGYDAVQLAAALNLRDRCLVVGLPLPLLITADGDLYAAARSEGLAVDDPNAHP